MDGRPDNPPPLPPAGAMVVDAGTQLGKYELVKRLSVGGMAEIFLAKVIGIPGFQKLVVVKRILPQLAYNPEFVTMFLDEARIAATLQHSNIVQTYDVCVVDGNYFIAMEYLHGEDVRSILRTAHKEGRRIPLEQVLQIVIALCSGLHYAHEKEGFDGRPLDIVHCDVSPGNLIVTYEGGVKLVDFGIARAANRAYETRSGTIKGKLGYISPEQARAEKLDRRTDVFAAGVILYELSLCKKLYKGSSDYEILHEIVEGKIVPPRKIDPTYDEELERIVLRALEKSRDKRYQSANDLQMDLEALARKRGLFFSGSGIKQLMAELFGNKLDAWRQAQRAGKSLLEVVAAFEDEAHFEEDEWSSEPVARGGKRRRHIWQVASAVGVAALVVGAAAVGLKSRKRPALPATIAPIAAKSTAPVATPSEPVSPPSALPKPTAQAATGSLKVVTHPRGATVSVDGGPPGARSPARFDELAGNQEHTVVAQLAGYAEERKRVTIVPGKSATLTLHLAKAHAAPARVAAPSAPAEAPPTAGGEGTLAVASNPWVNVAVDGVERGQTPLNLKLPAGKHTVTVTNPDYHIKRQIAVTIKANEIARKKLDFSE
jgi:hypothetical protein